MKGREKERKSTRVMHSKKELKERLKKHREKVKAKTS
jgi:hypothetical protein